MKNLSLFISIVFLTACGILQPSYFGDRYPATTSVDLFYSTHDVKRTYKVIGHLTMPNIGQDSVKSRIKAYARTVGADAVVITGKTVNNGRESASDIVNADALKYEK